MEYAWAPGNRDAADRPNVESTPMKAKDRLMELLKNRFFALVFGTLVGLPVVIVLYLFAGPDIFTNEGGSVDSSEVILFLPLNVGFILGMNYLAE